MRRLRAPGAGLALGLALLVLAFGALNLALANVGEADSLHDAARAAGGLGETLTFEATDEDVRIFAEADSEADLDAVTCRAADADGQRDLSAGRFAPSGLRNLGTVEAGAGEVAVVCRGAAGDELHLDAAAIGATAMRDTLLLYAAFGLGALGLLLVVVSFGRLAWRLVRRTA